MEGFREGVDVIRCLFGRITLAECSGQNTSVCEALSLPGYEEALPPSPSSTLSGQAEGGQAERSSPPSPLSSSSEYRVCQPFVLLTP